jgi:hypothetical protein
VGLSSADDAPDAKFSDKGNRKMQSSNSIAPFDYIIEDITDELANSTATHIEPEVTRVYPSEPVYICILEPGGSGNLPHWGLAVNWSLVVGWGLVAYWCLVAQWDFWWRYGQKGSKMRISPLDSGMDSPRGQTAVWQAPDRGMDKPQCLMAKPRRRRARMESRPPYMGNG